MIVDCSLIISSPDFIQISQAILFLYLILFFHLSKLCIHLISKTYNYIDYSCNAFQIKPKDLWEMKKIIIPTMFTLFVISFIFSSCVEHRYYKQNKHHSYGYYERRHMKVPVGIEIEIHK